MPKKNGNANNSGNSDTVVEGTLLCLRKMETQIILVIAIPLLKELIIQMGVGVLVLT